MEQQNIFIGGIHGVGKSTLCNMLSSELDILHFSASKLITLHQKTLSKSDKRVENIEKNQDILIQALNHNSDINNSFLLDGHFCVLNKDKEVSKIPEQTYISLNSVGIIVLHVDPSEILMRLKNRDGMKYDLDLTTNFQKEEISYSEHIAKILGVPYLLANPIAEKKVIKEFIIDVLIGKLNESTT